MVEVPSFATLQHTCFPVHPVLRDDKALYYRSLMEMIPEHQIGRIKHILT